ncbi:MAG: hypothetical protein WCI67_11810 [Chloroflexales bacterium]
MTNQSQRIITITLVVGLLIAVGTIGTLFALKTPASPVALGGSSLSVEADLFSGRPNPTWQLAPNDIQALQDDLAPLPLRAIPATAFDGLGYRGFIVRMIDDPQRDTLTIHVYHDIVRIERGGTTTVYEDVTRGVEHLLMQSASHNVPPDIYAILLSAAP